MSEIIQAVLNPRVPFIRYALIAGLLSSIPFGIIGSFVVSKRMTYIAGAVSHTALGGIGLALYAQTAFGILHFSPIIGALLFALTAGIIISITISKNRERVDSIIGTIWAVGMSIGLVFIYLTPGYIDPMSYLFGNILLVSKGNLITISILSVVIIGVCVSLFNQFVSISFDSEFARTRGIPAIVFEIVLILLISLTVILMITSIGIVMVIALLTIPPAMAGLFTKRMKSMMILSSVICALSTTLGLIISYAAELPTGSTTVILAGTAYLIALLLKRRR